MSYIIKPELIEMARKNTVVIESGDSLNSGLIISPRHILTASHCLKGKTTVIKNNKTYSVIDLEIGIPSVGVSLITLPEPVFHQPKIKICNQVEQGQVVFWTTLLFGQIAETLFTGYLAASVEHNGLVYYYINGGICEGMSGTGIYNIKGELVGMLMMSLEWENDSLAIPIAIPANYFIPLIAYARDDLLIKPKPESGTKNKSN
jgi:hypothetical protein